MKKAYDSPSMEWVDFNHKERIAASGGTGIIAQCTVTWENTGVNNSCDAKKQVYTSLVHN